MLLELSNQTDAGTHTFSPVDYLLGLIQHAMAAGANTRIILPGKGEITLLPVRGEYYSTVTNMAEFCSVRPTQFEVTTLAETAEPLPYAATSARSIKELLWIAGFHASQGRLVQGCSKYDVAQFKYWPNLTRLPVTANAARVCALLTRHPTTIMLLHRMLGVEKEEVYQLYSAAHCAGIATTISRTPESANLEAESAVPLPPSQERGIFRSLFAKISGL